MKKYLSIFIVLVILVSIGGCAKKSETSEESNVIETVDTSDNTVADEWPTKAWRTSSPEEQGLDANMLNKADIRINENYPNMYSLLVVRHGYLVYEKYYNGMDENNANQVFSVTKSVISALTGIAMQNKLIDNVDQTVSEFLPMYFTNIDDAAKKEITIKNVLTMTGGLESIDLDYPSYFRSKDWLSYALSKPITDKPGDKFVYNTGLTHFLSGIISKTSDMSTEDYANQYLFDPIGISVDNWEGDQNGVNGGGTGLYLKPVDMAKFGYLYLKKGLWDGKQIVPKEWIEVSTQKQLSVNEDNDYGYLFWLQTVQDNVHNKEYFTYRADGYAGQIIMMIPELDMVVVTTASEYTSSKDNTSTLDFINDYIIPAVK